MAQYNPAASVLCFVSLFYVLLDDATYKAGVMVT